MQIETACLKRFQDGVFVGYSSYEDGTTLIEAEQDAKRLSSNKIYKAAGASWEAVRVRVTVEELEAGDE